MLYQICILNKATKKDRVTVKHTLLVEANSMPEASKIAGQACDRSSFRVYPYCTPTDGESQIELARYAFYSYEKFERRISSSVMNSYSRNQYDREDCISIACLEIASIFAETPSADMYTLEKAAFSAIAREEQSKQRRAAREYNPDFIMHSISPRIAKATFPALDRLTRKAVETADLTEKQMLVIDLAYYGGMSLNDIADHMGITKAAAALSVNRAKEKVLAQMVELDSDLHTFTEAGITAEDINEIHTILRKRARR